VHVKAREVPTRWLQTLLENDGPRATGRLGSPEPAGPMASAVGLAPASLIPQGIPDIVCVPLSQIRLCES